eukprot:jgi/Botrbrau1/13305/Bobra.0315s0003.1
MAESEGDWKVLFEDNLADFRKGNETFVSSFSAGDKPMPPARKIAIVTCMDARLHPGKIPRAGDWRRACDPQCGWEGFSRCVALPRHLPAPSWYPGDCGH